MKTLIFAWILVLGLSTATLQAQSARDSLSTFWLDLGAGITNVAGGEDTYSKGSPGGRAAFNFRSGRVVITAPFTFNRSGVSRESGGQDRMYDFGLLAGYSMLDDSGWEMIVSAGPSVVWGSRINTQTSRSCYERDSYVGGGTYTYCSYSHDGNRSKVSPLIGIPLEFIVRPPVKGRPGAAGSWILHWNLNGEGTLFSVTFNFNL